MNHADETDVRNRRRWWQAGGVMLALFGLPVLPVAAEQAVPEQAVPENPAVPAAVEPPPAAVVAPAAAAEPREELLTLRNTMLQMLERLVDQEVLSVEEAQNIIEQAESEAALEAARLAALDTVEPTTQRISYVPDVVKEELRSQIMSDLKQDVVQEVLQEAQDDAWGVPGALPGWISDIRWTSDIRVRGEALLFDSGNAQLFNFQAINQAGGIGPAGRAALLNTTNDRERMRARIRLGLAMRVSDNWLAGVRVTTTNEDNPVSRNTTLGQGSADFGAILDLAYLSYRSENLLFTGGRMPNPFVRTELVWDNDLTFEGVAVTGRLDIGNRVDPTRAFLTLGAFPLEEIEFSDRDKWLYGGQAGLRYAFRNGGSVTLAGGYYLFDNVSGRRNAPESRLLDFTAPRFLQKGNTLFDIRNDTDLENSTSLFALASDFELLNGTLILDSGPVMRFGGERPVHVTFNADYVKNLGWDADDVFARTGLAGIDERTEGYSASLHFGSPSIRRQGDFRVGGFFRHLQRDAILDGFANSEFHRGGTDAEGWGIEAIYGVSRNTHIRLNYLTANEIDGPPLGIDVLQLDVLTRF